jgi:hypothetical protein
VADTKLGRNGSFGAFHILKQDVAQLEEFLQVAAPTIGLTPDGLAAKLLGRWRSGVPLALSDTGTSPIPSDRLNMFFAGGMISGVDPLSGACSPSSSVFTIPTSPTGSVKVTGFARFVTTRGSAYCFLPGITGLRYIASAGAE